MNIQLLLITVKSRYVIKIVLGKTEKLIIIQKLFAYVSSIITYLDPNFNLPPP